MQVRSVRLRRDKIVVALEHKVLVYNFADLRLLHSIETLSNPTGLLALSPASEQTVIACPGINSGQVACPVSIQLCIKPADVIQRPSMLARSTGLSSNIISEAQQYV